MSETGIGPGRIEKCFSIKKSKKEKVLIPFIMAGDPSLKFTERLSLEILANGGDILEIGLPYSDPLADGPVIQQASERAKEVTTSDVIELISNLRQSTDKPLVLLAYFNSIYKYGIEKFISEFCRAGIDGLVVPDLAWEEREKMEKNFGEQLDLIYFVAPTTSPHRIKEIAKRAKGFIYCVSVAGVTGTRKSSDFPVEDTIAQVKNYTGVPLCIGFGISTPAQAKKAGELADGVIVGSALIKKVSYLFTQEDLIAEPVGTTRPPVQEVDLSPVTSFIKELKSALK